MTTRTADRVDEWDSRPFSDGYEELHTLADRSFSGAITAGRATLYMLNGTVVGVLGGSIEDFEDATGTVYEAPTAALPLLAVMQERSDEVRAKYYSEETALAEADQQLSEGGFTGYVELSENVLSGDYYVVYHGGKSMSVAFVGESERLITDEEAFEQADEEVGIYEVRPAAVDPIEIPEPEPPDDDGSASAVPTNESADEPASEPDGQPDSGSASSGTAPESGSGAATRDTTEGAETADRDAGEPSTREGAPSEKRAGRSERSGDPERTSQQQSASTSTDPDGPARRSNRDPSRGADSSGESTAGRTRNSSDRESSQRPGSESSRSPEDEPRRPADSGSERPRRETEPRQSSHGESPQRRRDDREGHETRSETGQPSDRRRQQPVDESPRSGANRSRRSQEPVTESREPERDQRGRDRRSERSEATDRATEVAERAISEETPSGETAELEHRTIPSVDPERTWTPDGSDSEQSQAPPSQSTGQQARERGTRRSAPGSREPDTNAELEEAQAEIEDLQRRLDELETERADLEATRDELASERDALTEERDQLQAELDRVRTERDELQAEIEQLRQELDERESPSETAPAAETSLSPAQAIDGTNLFVRYESKGDATLKSAHDGSVDAEAVDANLNLEYHTGFEADEAAVDGRPFEEFLFETLHYRFVDWVVSTLLYEIRDTGHQNALADLYDALPRIDRAELNGSVTVSVTEEGEEQRTQEHFDVVLRDRMGNPLVVTNLNDSREAATDEMMTNLVTAATRVGESSDHLAGAFFVTSSFFDPDALETAAEASGGGILSRDKRESFVRLSRKDGFHLCLVESRDGGFHLAVPEL
ncbi:DUF7527 domain-containing protein [Halapricum salinum]|uniref:DUF7527 domain-containing protein n=1 Tax=Halapricum salinum TaxID=1457250 RepID=A0A4D6H9B4_9EURY|nr:hypothetical protein [Halapricum salinum]QCC50101.1 hypothetical protein DV733_02165 [Halapricum salinum]